MPTHAKTLIVTLLFLGAENSLAAEKLSDILRKSKWDGVIGTWVDTDTQGNRSKVTYAWKIRDRVIEITTKEESRESVALVGVNAKSGEIVHMGADSNGASFLGKWELKDNGDAVLGLAFTDGDGRPGALSIRHRLEGSDAMNVTLELPQPLSFRMNRLKPGK